MKSKAPMISVVIPMYNSKKYIQQAIDSVLEQTFKDAEIIVVDNYSTDGSYELCKKTYANDKNVSILRNQENRGVAFSRNRGISEARGKYVAFLDSDDVFLPYALELLYNTAEQYQSEVVSSIGYMMSNDENIPKDFSGISRVCVEEVPVQKNTLIEYPPPMQVQNISNLK